MFGNDNTGKSGKSKNLLGLLDPFKEGEQSQEEKESLNELITAYSETLENLKVITSSWEEIKIRKTNLFEKELKKFDDKIYDDPDYNELLKLLQKSKTVDGLSVLKQEAEREYLTALKLKKFYENTLASLKSTKEKTHIPSSDPETNIN